MGDKLSVLSTAHSAFAALSAGSCGKSMCKSLSVVLAALNARCLLSAGCRSAKVCCSSSYLAAVRAQALVGMCGSVCRISHKVSCRLAVLLAANLTYGGIVAAFSAGMLV